MRPCEMMMRDEVTDVTETELRTGWDVCNTVGKY